MVFGVRTKEWLAATDANVGALGFRVLVFSGAGRLGSLPPRDVVLLVR